MSTGNRLEPRFTPIPHEMLEALARAHLSAPAREVLDVVFRQTLGWSRDSHSMSISFFAKATSRHRNVIRKAVRELVGRNIIQMTGAATFRLSAVWSIQPVEHWREVPQKVTGTQPGTSQERSQSRTGTSGGTRTGTQPGTSEVHPNVPGEVLSQVPKERQIEKCYRQEKETSSPLLKVPPRGNIAGSTKNVLPAGPVLQFSNPIQKPKAVAPESGNGNGSVPQKQDHSPREYLEFMYEVYRDVYGSPPGEFDKKQKEEIIGIMESQSRSLGRLTSDFARSCKAFKGKLSHQPGPEHFVYLLRNRQANAVRQYQGVQ